MFKEKAKKEQKASQARQFTGLEIAVIGMAGRFPRAKNIAQFWDNLINGVEGLSFVSDEELKEAGVPPEVTENPIFVKGKGGVLENKEYFDASFFDYSPREAQLMDPQMRIFHECTWEALEDAGYDPFTYEKAIGLYAGSDSSLHWENIVHLSKAGREFGIWATSQFSDKDFLPTRVSHRLNLKGPAVVIQTACSTSLVAIHIACRALLTGDCHMALAGGVRVAPARELGYLYREGMIMSPDGYCRAFDAKARGAVPGNGAGVVVLKPLKKAISDGDHIYAVVKGSAINNDGVRKVGFTAPSVKGQADVIRAALNFAHVEPETITYVETHGTGTVLGDPIEIEALKTAFNIDVNKKRFCAIGSVKTNVGHMGSAAGVTGFIKTILALKNRLIPPSLYFESPNPEIDFDNSPFFVNTKPRKWTNNKYSLRAGVSSFGVGGTNAHAILEEWPDKTSTSPMGGVMPHKPQLLLLSARTQSALDQTSQNLADYLKKNPGINLANAAYTLQLGRKDFRHRRLTVCSTVDEAVEALSAVTPEKVRTWQLEDNDEDRPLVFMFSGQGAQYVNMGLELYKKEAVFQEEIDRCFDILNKKMGYDIKDILYPVEAGSDSSHEGDSRKKIDDVLYSGPIKFSFEYALAKLLMKWGIKPYALIGHSFGEYAAAQLSGVFSLEDALKLVVMRGKLMHKVPDGAMMSVPLAESRLSPLLNDEISLAAVNSSSLCFVSGPAAAIDKFEKQLNEKGHDCLRINFPRASHSKMMEAVSKEFEGFVSRVRLNPPNIPYIAGLTGSWISAAQATSPAYWSRHLIETVRFSDGIKTLLAEANPILVQVGCDRGLPLFVNQQQGLKHKPLVINMVKHRKEEVPDDYYLLDSIGFLWLKGVKIDWSEFYSGEKRYRLSLPTYPFERKRYWFGRDPFQWGVDNPMVVTQFSSGQEETVENVPAGIPGTGPAAAIVGTLHERPRLSKEYVAPSNKTQQIMVNIWQEFFGIEPIGVDDDFFELGGDSLMASIVSSRIHRELDTPVPITEFFAGPTIKRLALFIEGNSGTTVFSPIESLEKKEYYLLSSAQSRLYVLQQFDQEGLGYNISNLSILEGILDKSRFENTFRRLLERHESLRTSFRMLREEPVQMVRDRAAFEIEYFDLTNAQVEAEVKEVIRSFIRPFDMAQAPLFRVGLIKLPENGTIPLTDRAGTSHLLVVDIHHIVSDGVSMSVLIREFMSFYSGVEPVGSSIRITYKDFSEWQSSKEVRETMNQQEKYWLKEFQGEIPVLNAPTDFARPLIQSFEGSIIDFEIDKQDTRVLKEYAPEEGVTLFMVLLTVYNIFLFKICAQEDIIVGTPTAGRHHADLENVVGMFANTLILRNFPTGEKSFKQFLVEVKDRTLDAFSNQIYQYEELVEKVVLDRDAGRNPLFDTMFILQNMDIPEFEIPGLKLKPYNYDPGTSVFDLIFRGTELDERVMYECQYCTKLFKKSTIERYISYFKRIISIIIENPEIKISDIEIISEDERKQVLFDLNNTKVEFPDGVKTAHVLFQQQVEASPDGLALVFTHHQVTYRELNKKTNQLARLLRSRGIGPNDIVGLMMERSIELIIGIIAIIKVGGAYLPIDPGYPQERVKYMLEDSKVSLVLIQKAILDTYPVTLLKNITTTERHPGIIVTPSRSQILDFDGIPFPDRTLVDYRKYHRRIGIAMAKHTVSIQATRGCPYKCAYCHRIWSRKYITRSAENIFEEILRCYDAGVKRFVFIDDIFNLAVANSARLMETIIHRNLDVQLFFPNGLRGDILKKDFIDLMIEAGTVNIDLALESASPRVQKLMGKNLQLDKFRENVQYICQKYPQVVLEKEAIIGFPTETTEEAMMTLEFLESFKWLHFPNLNILKIYPNTAMYGLAIQNGISREKIHRSVNLAYHELPETLPFPKDFVMEYQTRFLEEYFLDSQRLAHVLPYQMQSFTEDELIQKYNSYLPMKIECFNDILALGNLSMDDLGESKNGKFLPVDYCGAPDFSENMQTYFPAAPKTKNDAIRVLLVDVSLLFTTQSEGMLYDMVEAPLGLMYLMTYLNQRFGHQVCGKVIKSRIDFDSYGELKQILDEFGPDVIGIRTLSYYREFFHKTVFMIRQWGIDVPIITGGPYATSDYQSILQDTGVDLVVLGEGELTMAELVEKMIENGKKLPGQEVLEEIRGLAFVKNNIAERTRSREILLVHELAGTLAGYPDANLEEKVNGNDPLYVIYTSGSTGRPKGVILEHINLVNLILFGYEFTNLDFSAVLQFATISFDASFHEIFSTLLSGGRLLLIDQETRGNISDLFKTIEKNKIRTVFLPMSLLKLIFSEKEYINVFPGCVKHIQTAGEQVVVNDALRDYLKEKHIFLHNHYGPSETHVVTTLTLEPQADIPGLPPIGKPVSNTGIYIMDQYGKVQPIGVPGELYIGGIQVGRGYLNRPELTAEKFDQDLWDLQDYHDEKNNQKFLRGVQGGSFYKKRPPGRRRQKIYKTGDLARWLVDGNIEFLGRIDHQVKIRGFRVELGEIETQLLKHEEIKEVVVAARELENKDKYLCAYIVSKSKILVSDLRRFLSERVPDYMIPANFVFLERIPVNESGKVDRKALPDPVFGMGVEAYTAPENDIEKKLLQIWSDILALEVEKIGVTGNFFQFGGHSLRATVMISRVHRDLNVRIPLAEVFRTPTIRGLAAYIKCLNEDKYTLIESTEKKEYYVLSPSQKRLYILQQMGFVGTGYNLPEIIPLGEQVNIKQLEKAFVQLIQRHESFRTSFAMVDEEPVQRIHDEVKFEVEYYDVQGNRFTKDSGKVSSHLSTSPVHLYRYRYMGPDGKSILHTRSFDNFIRSFDLSEAPLFRVGLIEIADHKHLLMVDMHHIATDGVSNQILLREFLALYENAQSLSPLRIQYKDFAEWQNTPGNREAVKRQEDYWLKEFEGEIPILSLPCDYVRPSIQSFEGGILDFEISPEYTRALEFLAFQEEATLYMVLLALLDILFSKLSGQEDLVVGSPVAGRRHADLESIIGIFVNTLPLRNFPQGDKSFREFLREVKDRTLEAFENQDYPFEELVEKVSVPRDPGRNPIFDIMFLFLDFFEEAGLAVMDHFQDERSPGQNQYQLEAHPARFDLTALVEQRNGKLFFVFEYCTKLFKKETIERFTVCFEKIISFIIKNPDLKVWQIEIIPEDEKERILYDFNNTELGYPRDKTLQQLFEEQVEQNPDSVAVIFEKQHLSYKILYRRSNQLAQTLITKESPKDMVIGLIVQRSLEMLIGILGILQAGAAYLPIDPRYPEERIKYMLKDSAANILVTQQDVLEKMSGKLNTREILDLNKMLLPVVHDYETVENEKKYSHDPGNLAYVIYTSGSTGKPKGVTISHRNVINFIYGITTKIRFLPGKAILALTTLSFDIFVLETLLPLVNGLKIVIATENQQRDPQLLADKIVTENVNMMQMTPSSLKLLNDSEVGLSCLEDVEVLMVGGESFPQNLFERLKVDYKGHIYNMYGPTETTVWSSLSNLTLSEKIDIGTPIANTQIYILDPYNSLQPMGVAGELYIGGDGRARGYLNQPELTAEKFVLAHRSWLITDRAVKAGVVESPMSYQLSAMSCIYKTGDLAWWLPEGYIEFLGRIDHQVKIRGHRIELGEIESQLLYHPEAQEAVVLARGNEEGERYLCAYVIAGSKEQGVGEGELREYLSRTLPDYMIPSYFVFLEALPLTPNGKLDRGALPAPELKAGEGYIAPRDAVEEKLVEVWSEVLGLENDIIGINNNFFDLGGHSLRATIMISKIHKELNAQVPLAEIFKNPTIMKLSEYIRGLAETRYAAIEPVEKKEYYTLSSAQKRMYFIQQMDPSSTAYNLPHLVTMEKELEKEQMEGAVKKLLNRHESLRTSFHMIADEPAQKMHHEVEFTIDYYEFKPGPDKTGIEIEKIVKNFVKFFDLSKAPLLRISLIKIEKIRYILLIDMHHIITDGVSTAILVNNFHSLYEGKELSPLRIQYKDYAEWQEREMEGGILKQQEEYWLQQFSGEIPVIDLPNDYPRPEVQSFEGDFITLEIDKTLTKKIMRFVKKKELTLNIFLLAVYSVLLAKYSGQDDIVIGTAVAGRRHADLQQIIGMFVNMLPLRIQPKKNKIFNKFLVDVKNYSINAYENQDYQFDDLVLQLGLKGNRSRNPIFDTVFVMQNTSDLIENQDILESNEDHLSMEIPQLEVQNQLFDLILQAIEGNDAINIWLNYSTKLFKESTAKAMLKHYMDILEQVLENPDLRLEKITVSHNFLVARADSIEKGHGDFRF